MRTLAFTLIGAALGLFLGFSSPAEAGAPPGRCFCGGNSATPSGSSSTYTYGQFSMVDAGIVQAIFIDGGHGMFGGESGSLVNDTTICIGGSAADLTCTNMQLAFTGGTAYLQNLANGGNININGGIANSVTWTSSATSGNIAFYNNNEGARSYFGPDTYCAESGTTIACTATGGVTLGTRQLAAAAPTDGGATLVYEEYGNCLLSGSACTATFKNAFSVGPRCTCSHVAAVPIACGPTAVASTTQVTFAVPAGTGSVDWHCVGDR
jgi:hypothetical protein